jgi:hypothetical protein|tara:strand:+ start:129 stop:377 length:249 start_codon:yes stop_codon:yes gene_type:complete
MMEDINLNNIQKYAPKDSNKIVVWEKERKNDKCPSFSGYLTNSNKEVYEVTLWINLSSNDKTYLSGEVKETNLKFVKNDEDL